MIIDTHAHLYAEEFSEDQTEVFTRAVAAGVHYFLLPNINSESIPLMEKLMKEQKNTIPMMGLHPCEVGDDFEAQLQVMENWLNSRYFAAVGEIGTDLYWDKTNLDRQLAALEIQVGWAKAKELPIVLHCRESIDLTIDFIEKMHDGKLRGIFHCFTGTLDQANRIVEMGFLLGIGGVATYKNGGLDQVIPYIGLEHLVLETDAPYLAPVPHRGKRNTPAFLPFVAQRVADLLQVPAAVVAESTCAQALQLFTKIEK